MRATATILLMLCTFPLCAADGPRLDEVETALRVDPRNPMLHYRKCQALFASGQEQAAIDHAAIAMKHFKAARKELAWMRLGTLLTDNYRIEVHYNMGPQETAEKRDGIVRPYSFRVWTKEPEPRMLRIVDFELAYSKNKVQTAALGEMQGDNHANYGTLDPKSDFATVKRKMLEVLSQ